MPNPRRGVSKHGGIRWGWVPPTGSVVTVDNTKTLQGCLEYSEEQLLEQMKRDMIKVLEDHLREQLSG